MLAQLVPELALARVVTAGGPYRPGDEISLAFMTPTVSRLVAHDAELRAKCVPLENALIPEIISVLITHPAAPYEPGDVLTLSFVDPRVARVYARDEHPFATSESEPRNPAPPNDATGTTELGVSAGAENLGTAPPSIARATSVSPPSTRTLGGANGRDSHARDVAPAGTESSDKGVSFAPEIATPATSDDGASVAREDTRAQAESSARDTSQSVPARTTVITSGSGSTYTPHGARAASLPIRAGERMTLAADALLGVERRIGMAEPHTADHAGDRGAPERPLAGISVRLEWTQDRLRRFVQVVDKLFTIDRLGWYRHSLAMRLLIPDEIACDDALTNVEAMRHLQALRAAAVESLGKPLLAACMPGFSIASEWLESLESSREARAIAGLRDALLPYATDDESTDTPPADAIFTLGTIGRRQLLACNATSVEAFLPLLIAASSHDSALTARLTEYRRLLVELFAQTANAGESVRLHQMAQPNHSLDDRLWQLVGAAGEAFGGFAPA